MHVRYGEFQSAPPVETRGDFLQSRKELIEKLFQSAPPVETRGDECKSSFIALF